MWGWLSEGSYIAFHHLTPKLSSSKMCAKQPQTQRTLSLISVARKNWILPISLWLTDPFHLIFSCPYPLPYRVMAKAIRIYRTGHGWTILNVVPCTVGTVEAVFTKDADWRTLAKSVWVERACTVFGLVALTIFNHHTIPIFHDQALCAVGSYSLFWCKPFHIHSLHPFWGMNMLPLTSL